tara:strand:- start:661 stop:1806 length:1146 start_codon:yes stop_codon:yes gene_type:complete
MTSDKSANDKLKTPLYGHAYFCVDSLELWQLFQLQTFLFDYFSVEFLNVEQMDSNADWDTYGNETPENTLFDVECLLFIRLDDNGDIDEWVATGIANSAQLGAELVSLYLIDEEKLNNKKAELGLSDDQEYDPINRWLSKYLFFDNYKGDEEVTSRNYKISQNPCFVFEKKDDSNFVRDNRSDQEKSEAKLQLGYSHSKKNRFTEAANCFTYSAEKGNYEAQCNLGAMYTEGLGVTKDPKKAFNYYLEAARAHSNDDLGANYFVASAYDLGKGVEQDAELALYWYQKAAERGDVHSQTNLGIMYFNGEGTEKNHKMAFKFLQLAAEAGYPRGQFNLAEIYRDGSEFTPKDINVALHWFTLSAEQGYAYSITEREKLLKLIN